MLRSSKDASAVVVESMPVPTVGATFSEPSTAFSFFSFNSATLWVPFVAAAFVFAAFVVGFVGVGAVGVWFPLRPVAAAGWGFGGWSLGGAVVVRSAVGGWIGCCDTGKDISHQRMAQRRARNTNAPGGVAASASESGSAGLI